MNLNKQECICAISSFYRVVTKMAKIEGEWDWERDILLELINEYFDNPSLKFEKLTLKLEELNKQLDIKDKMIDVLIYALMDVHLLIGYDQCYGCPCSDICPSELDCLKLLRKWSEEEVLKNE